MLVNLPLISRGAKVVPPNDSSWCHRVAFIILILFIHFTKFSSLYYPLHHCQQALGSVLFEFLGRIPVKLWRVAPCTLWRHTRHNANSLLQWGSFSIKRIIFSCQNHKRTTFLSEWFNRIVRYIFNISI